MRVFTDGASISHGGQEYKADKDGFVDAPQEVIAHLESCHYTRGRNQPAGRVKFATDKPEAKDTRTPAQKLEDAKKAQGDPKGKTKQE